MTRAGRRRRQAAAVDAALQAVREELAATRAEVAVLASDAAAARRERDLAPADPPPPAISVAETSPAPGPVAPPLPAPADPELLGALGALTRACEAVAAEMRADRRSRGELRDTVATIAALLAATPVTASPGEVRPTVLGGSVDPAPPHEIVLDADGEPPRDGVEVRCRFGDHWVSGFDVVDVVEEAGAMRYRLRRRSDGCILPAFFAAADVRFFTTAPATP